VDDDNHDTKPNDDDTGAEYPGKDTGKIPGF